MNILELVLQIAAVGAAFTAALFWFHSARIKLPNAVEWEHLSNVHSDGSYINIFRRQARLSSRAAIAAGIAAFTQGSALGLSFI